jgi:hypothetical protein
MLDRDNGGQTTAVTEWVGAANYAGRRRTATLYAVLQAIREGGKSAIDLARLAASFALQRFPDDPATWSPVTITDKIISDSLLRRRSLLSLKFSRLVIRDSSIGGPIDMNPGGVMDLHATRVGNGRGPAFISLDRVYPTRPFIEGDADRPTAQQNQTAILLPGDPVRPPPRVRFFDCDVRTPLGFERAAWPEFEFLGNTTIDGRRP